LLTAPNPPQLSVWRSWPSGAHEAAAGWHWQLLVVGLQTLPGRLLQSAAEPQEGTHALWLQR
jgi:hypothetical protein